MNKIKKGLNTLGKSVFLKTFGNYPMNRIFDFLVVFDKLDYSITDIMKGANVSRVVIYELIEYLLKKKIVVVSRIRANSKMYKLNKANRTIIKFEKFYWDITKLK